MRPLFTLSVMVEPDRQRFARFAYEAIESLGGNAFTAAPRLVEATAMLRIHCTDTEVKAQLTLAGNNLHATCGNASVLLACLPSLPSEQQVSALAERLREASETADPELLKRRNQKIKADLDRFMRVSSAQMAEVEAALEKKKAELQELVHVAETDGLTGLLNRGAYDQRLRDAVVRSLRQGEPLSLILLDLDKFKEINDTHGHQFGDEYLRRMADSLRRAAREGVDHLCRFGGDEFAIIVFAASPVAERIAERVLEFMHHKVSIGVAELEPGDDVVSFVARADAALYAAKHKGRGQYVSAAACPESTA